MTEMDFLRHEAAELLLNFPMTPQERRELLAWVDDGNSACNNPWYMADERGAPMNYIEALRICSLGNPAL